MLPAALAVAVLAASTLGADARAAGSFVPIRAITPKAAAMSGATVVPARIEVPHPTSRGGASDGFLPIRIRATAPTGATNLCAQYGWACAGSARSRAEAGHLALARQVNLAVNRGTRQVSDQSQYHSAERWALPSRRGGDCEDLALLKKYHLVKQGVPARALLLATALDRNRNPHAVLVLRTAGGDLVLDNLDDRVRDWRQTGYVFLRMQDPEAPSRWVGVLAGG